MTTNESGKKILVDADGNWRYFLDGPTADSNKFNLPQTAILEREKRLEAARVEEQKISFALIKKRVELTDLLLELQQTTDNFPYKKKQLKQLQAKVAELEESLQSVRDRLLFLEKIKNLPEESYNRKLRNWADNNPIQQTDKLVTATVALKPATSPVPTLILSGLLNEPPPQPCTLGTQALDPQAQEIFWQNKPSHFFSYTDQAVESRFPKRDFLESRAYLSAMDGGRKFLNLELAVATEKAPGIFGSLPKGEFLEILLLSGEKVTLFNSLPSNGQWVAATGAYIYQGKYPLGIREEKLLRSAEADRVLLRWSLVQEEFELYETDFFLRQFDCLEALLNKEN